MVVLGTNHSNCSSPSAIQLPIKNAFDFSGTESAETLMQKIMQTSYELDGNICINPFLNMATTGLSSSM